MADAPLILAPLKRAIATLEEALIAPDSGFVRDSIVKRFEYTYEVAWRFMRRHLIWAALEAEPQTRRDLVRAAARAGCPSRLPEPALSTIRKRGSLSMRRGT